MKTYLVGGAVRDILLGLEPKDKDYVVVGSTPKKMKENGFSQVGADFPVFLCQKTGDEYALARREKKTGKGYLGFESEFTPDVTLEEDLGRRDLTINSIAMDPYAQKYIDPFNGYYDITRKILRHTSDAFWEDPVRVLRLARFRARLGPNWAVAKETHDVIRQMSKKGVLDELQPDRVWKEMSRALMEKHPRLFFDTLLETDCLHKLFPDLYRLKSALESRFWHPEGDAFEHTMLVLQAAAKYEDNSLDDMYACLVHDIGKGITPHEKLPSHHGHDVNGVPIVQKFSENWNVPKKTREKAKFSTRYHMYMHKLESLNAKTYVKMFDEATDQKVQTLFNVGVADEQGRLGSENNEIEHLNFLFVAWNAYKSVTFRSIFGDNTHQSPNAIREAFRKHRTQAIQEAKKTYFER